MPGKPSQRLRSSIPNGQNAKLAFEQLFDSSLEEHRDLHQEHGVQDVFMPGINKLSKEQIEHGKGQTRELAQRAAADRAAAKEEWDSGLDVRPPGRGKSFSVNIDISKLRE